VKNKQETANAPNGEKKNVIGDLLKYSSLFGKAEKLYKEDEIKQMTALMK
jgi:hypothetical protein